MDRAFLNIRIQHLLFIIFSLIFTPIFVQSSPQQQQNNTHTISNTDTLKNSEADRKVKIEEISLTRHSAKREIERSGFAANVIETKQAALRNMQTNELLDRTVGVRVRQNGGLGAQVDYNLNGMSGRAVGIFIDGIEISTYGSSFNLSNIPPAMIERIEVYKGVLPAHLSGDLLGGAINVVLKKEAAQNTLAASVSYGSFNTLQSEISGIYRKVTSGLTARGSMFYGYSDNDYEIWGKFARNTLPDGTMENTRAKRFFDAYKTLVGRFELGFTDVAWADALMLGYNGSSTYNEIQHGLYMTQPYMGRFTQSEAHVLSLNYSKSHLLTEGLHLRLNGVYSDRDQYVQDTVSWNYNWSGQQMIGFHGVPIRTSGGAQQGVPTMNDISRQIVTMRSDLEYELNRNHSLRLNHVFYTVDRQDHDRIRHVAEQLYQSTSTLGKNVTSLAYESQLLDRRLKTNVFAKWYQQGINRIDPYVQTIDGRTEYAENRIRDQRQTLGYGMAVSYSLSPGILLLSSAEKAVRMPAEMEIFGGPEENIVANPNLKAEISNNLNFGFRLDILSLEQHKMSLSGTGFARNIKDKIVRKAEDRLVNEAVETMPFENLGLAQSIGFEGELNYAYADRFNAMLNFSKFNALFKQEFDPATGLRLERYNKQLPNEPFFTMNTSLHYRLHSVFQKSSILSLYYQLGYVDHFNTIWIKSTNTMTPRQFSQDLGASYLFPHRKLVLSLDVKNIFNAEIYDNFAVQKPGRALYLKLNYTINRF